MKAKIRKIINYIILIPKLRRLRKVTILKKQIELIINTTDVITVKDFLDETPLKKPPFSKVRAAFYVVIVLCILTLFGINIDPILLLLKPMLF